jgi:pyruvate kinase
MSGCSISVPMQRRAKIAGTLGPACNSSRTLTKMVRRGMDVARLNFSHGDRETHSGLVRELRRASAKAGRPVALLADLQGPRFRIGELPGDLVLTAGARVKLHTGKRRCVPGGLPVTYAALARDVKRGDRVLIDDGRIELTVTGKRGSDVICEVIRGGSVSDNKGINLPDSSLSVPAVTAKDARDLKTAVELGADWLAVSFVRRAADVARARRLLTKTGSSIPVLAKIERAEAIDRLDEILQEADGLMVARGDLGVELSAARVPILQKQIIERANSLGKPVITATQMLDSMRHSSRPTRAEVSDVANAVLDGSGCLLLTAETAAGKYPVESIEMMAEIIDEAESSGRTQRQRPPDGELSITTTTCHAGCYAAADVKATALAVFTRGGATAFHTARFRPDTPILAFTPSVEVERRLALAWGVQPFRLAERRGLHALLRGLDRTLLDQRLAKRNDIVVVLMGDRIGGAALSRTNLMRIHRVGSSLTEG